MGIVVQKYGGSSVADVQKIRAVAERIVATRAQGHQVVAVVSAMGKKTDELLALADEVSPNPGRRELDMLVSVGERISMTLLSMAVAQLGYEAKSFTGSQSGIITDTSHFNAKILEVRPERLVQALEAGDIVIVAGYQGVSIDKEVTTLGRGGTDTTAVALAAALGADYCEICSDVDGVYSSDPRRVAEAHHIPALSYDEMLTLSHQGAKVLAAEAVEYAKRHGIEIRAASTFGSRDKYSKIQLATERRGVVAITHDANLIRLCFHGDGPTCQAFMTWWNRLGYAPQKMAFTHGECSKVEIDFRTVNMPDLDAFLSEAQSQWGDALAVGRSTGTVSVIGTGISLEPHLLERTLAALAKENITPLAFESRMNVLVIDLKIDDLQRAEGLLHLALLGEEVRS